MEKGELIRKMESVVGKGNVLHRHTDLLVYEYDASLHRGLSGLPCPATLWHKGTASIVKSLTSLISWIEP